MKDILKKINMFLANETTTTGDIALPPDKASMRDIKDKKKKKKLLLGKDGEMKSGKPS